MNIHAIFPLFVFLLTSILGLLVISRNRQSPVNRSFFLVTVILCVWLISYFNLFRTTDQSAAIFWAKCATSAVIFIPLSLYQYIIFFLDLKRDKKLLICFYLWGAFALWATFNTNLLAQGVKLYYWGYFGLGGPLLKLHGLIYVVALIRINIALITEIKRKDIAANRIVQIRYLILAFFLALLAGLDFIPTFGIESYPVAYIMTFVMFSIIAYTIVRYHLMDIRVAMTRAGIFLLLYTPLLGIPIYLAYMNRFTPRLWWMPVSFAVLFATAGPLIYRTLQTKAEALLLAQQRHYQKILLQAAGGMVTEHEQARLFKLIVYIIKKAVGINFTAIFAHDRERHEYVLQAVRGRYIDPAASIMSDESGFIAHLKEHGNPLTADEFGEHLNKFLGQKMNGPFEVVIPAVANDKMLAFLVLGTKKDKSHYSQDDINVFRILSHQASLAIQNCYFFEEFKKVQEELFQAEKLASIGGIADGVAHQIKNRLNHFSLASGELKLSINDFLEKNPEYQQNPQITEIFEYLKNLTESISMNVSKTDGIVKGILNFARTSEKDTFFNFFRLEELITSGVGLLSVKHELNEVPLEKKIEEVDEIWGVKAQLNEVIYNLLDNAYEATQERYESMPVEEYDNYQPRLTIEANEENEHYLIKVSDNGMGIKESNRGKMFAPFFTTKSSYKSGSGIGMYVCRRIVEENHNGKIWFETEYGKGTTFFIELPKPQNRHPQDGTAQPPAETPPGEPSSTV